MIPYTVTMVMEEEMGWRRRSSGERLSTVCNSEPLPVTMNHYMTCTLDKSTHYNTVL